MIRKWTEKFIKKSSLLLTFDQGDTGTATSIEVLTARTTLGEKKKKKKKKGSFDFPANTHNIYTKNFLKFYNIF